MDNQEIVGQLKKLLGNQEIVLGNQISVSGCPLIAQLLFRLVTFDLAVTEFCLY